MTLLIATLRPDFALVSQDTFATDMSAALEPVPGVIASDVNEAAASAFQGRGVAPDVAPLSFTSKIALLPHMPMIVAGNGCYVTFLNWVRALTLYNLANDPDSLALIAPMMLREIRQQSRSTMGLLCIHVGLDAETGQIAGFVCASEQGFEAVPLNPKGHTIAPMVATDDPAYGELAQRWVDCETPAACEDFHLRAAQNQYAAWRRGLYREGASMGGQLHTARLDPAGGLSVRVTHEFPNYREHLERVRLSNRFLVYNALQVGSQHDPARDAAAPRPDPRAPGPPGSYPGRGRPT